MEKTIEAPQIRPGAEIISYEEFLKDYTDVHAEWIDGEAIVLTTASDRHQDIIRWLITILSIFIETYDLGWLRPAPFNIHLPHLGRGREPDLLFVAKDTHCTILTPI